MRVIIDRFEGNYAIVEMNIGNMCVIPRKLIPDAKENDVIDIDINEEETIKRKEEISELSKKVFEE